MVEHLKNTYSISLNDIRIIEDDKGNKTYEVYNDPTITFGFLAQPGTDIYYEAGIEVNHVYTSNKFYDSLDISFVEEGEGISIDFHDPNTNDLSNILSEYEATEGYFEDEDEAYEYDEDFDGVSIYSSTSVDFN